MLCCSSPNLVDDSEESIEANLRGTLGHVSRWIVHSKKELKESQKRHAQLEALRQQIERRRALVDQERVQLLKELENSRLRIKELEQLTVELDTRDVELKAAQCRLQEEVGIVKQFEQRIGHHLNGMIQIVTTAECDVAGGSRGGTLEAATATVLPQNTITSSGEDHPVIAATPNQAVDVSSPTTTTTSTSTTTTTSNATAIE